MKKVKVKYLLNNEGQIVDRFLIETEADIQEALKQKHISALHVGGMKSLVAKGEQLILNNSGGYCPAKNTWEILN